MYWCEPIIIHLEPLAQRITDFRWILHDLINDQRIGNIIHIRYASGPRVDIVYCQMQTMAAAIVRKSSLNISGTFAELPVAQGIRIIAQVWKWNKCICVAYHIGQPCFIKIDGHCIVPKIYLIFIHIKGASSGCWWITIDPERWWTAICCQCYVVPRGIRNLISINFNTIHTHFYESISANTYWFIPD